MAECFSIRRQNKAGEKESIAGSCREYIHIKGYKPIEKYAFVFICQQGDLEIKSALLAVSLRRFVRCPHELIAAIPLPESVFGRPHPVTMELLRKIGARPFYFRNPLVNKKRFCHPFIATNKEFAIRAENSSEKLIFLDSDVLCCKDFLGDQRFVIPFNGGLDAGGGVWSLEGKYEELYRINGIKAPLIRLKYTVGDERFTPPILNDGLFAIDAKLACELGNMWLKVFKRIEWSRAMREPKRRWVTNQASLLIAVHKLNLPYDILERSWLYGKEPFFHWHQVENIIKDSELLNIVRSIIVEYPEVKEIISIFSKEYSAFSRPAAKAVPESWDMLLREIEMR